MHIKAACGISPGIQTLKSQKSYSIPQNIRNSLGIS